MPVPERAEQEEGPALRPVLARHGREMAPAQLAEARSRRCGRSGVAWLRGAENMGWAHVENLAWSEQAARRSANCSDTQSPKALCKPIACVDAECV